MKGLLLKDFALMKGQRRFFLMLLLIGMIPALAGGNVGFLTVYLPLASAFLPYLLSVMMRLTIACPFC